MLDLFLPGDPVPKGRPRMTRSGHAFTPAKTREYEARLRDEASRAWTHAPLTAPLQVTVTAVFAVPKSYTKLERERALVGDRLPRPDADNLAKVIDALNGVVWVDDTQIARLTVIKRYGDQPGLYLSVRL